MNLWQNKRGSLGPKLGVAQPSKKHGFVARRCMTGPGSKKRDAYSTILSKSFLDARLAGEKITISHFIESARQAAKMPMLRAGGWSVSIGPT